MKVKFLSPVQHDADRYQPGDTADLPKAAAEQLIAVGAAEVFDPVAARAAAKAKAEAEAAELAAKRKAIEDRALPLHEELKKPETTAERKAEIEQQLAALRAEYEALG